MSQLSLINAVLNLKLTNEEKISLVQKINSLDSLDSSESKNKELMQETNFLQSNITYGIHIEFKRTINNEVYHCTLRSDVTRKKINITISLTTSHTYVSKHYQKLEVNDSSKWVLFTNNTFIDSINLVDTEYLTTHLNQIADDVFNKYGNYVMTIKNENNTIDEIIETLQKLKK